MCGRCTALGCTRFRPAAPAIPAPPASFANDKHAYDIYPRVFRAPTKNPKVCPNRSASCTSAAARQHNLLTRARVPTHGAWRRSGEVADTMEAMGKETKAIADHVNELEATLTSLGKAHALLETRSATQLAAMSKRL